MRIETLILKSLLLNETYCRSVLPYLKSEYFTDFTDKTIFKTISGFVSTYNEQPTVEALRVILSESSLKEEESGSALDSLEEYVEGEENNLEWLTDKTEEFCKQQAIHNAVLESIHIISDKKEKKDKGIIPDLLKEALSVSFDPTVGHDFMEDYESRYDFYHRKEERIPFDIEQFNVITKGGVPRKTLNIILAGTNVGKSLAMCHFATANLLQGLNVLYITLEMAEEKIAERIDANLLDISLENLSLISKEQYSKLIVSAQKRSVGRLIVKEYPTSSANVNHFRHLLSELSLKKKFVPDIIYIDYLNICASSRIKFSPNVNSYTIIKSIAEEIRGLAVEFNVPIFSATQTNRTGFSSSDVELTDTSESFGLPATADFMFALINTEELEKLSQLMVKQLKNRYADKALTKKFFVGVDRSKMRLYQTSESTAASDASNDDEDYYSDSTGYSGRSSLKDKFNNFKF
jgi:replicative DNA helicase